MYKSFLFLFSVLLLTSCASDEAILRENNYQNKATVLRKGTDCGGTWLKEITHSSDPSRLPESIHYADSLPDEFKVKNLEIYFNGQPNNEWFCTTQGFFYPHVTIHRGAVIE